jgi:hypothetical protein
MNLIKDILNDYREVIIKAEEPTRNYEKKSSHIYKPEQARYKLVIWFKDAQRRIYYSYDHQYHNKEKHIDEFQSLVKLKRLVDKHKADDKVKTAVIYATLDPERKITSDYCHEIYYLNILGQDKKNKVVSFDVKGKDNLLNLKRLELYSSQKLTR